MGASLLQPPGTSAGLFLCLIHWSGSHWFQNLPAPPLGPGREAGQGAPQPVPSGMCVLRVSSALGLARHRHQGPAGSPGPRPRWTAWTALTSTTETGQWGDLLPEPDHPPQCQSRAREGPWYPPAPPGSLALCPGGTPRILEQGAPSPAEVCVHSVPSFPIREGGGALGKLDQDGGCFLKLLERRAGREAPRGGGSGPWRRHP